MTSNQTLKQHTKDFLEDYNNNDKLWDNSDLIGSGSGRKVYSLHNGLAAKVADGEEGTSQNTFEKQIYDELKDDEDYDFLAPVFAISDNEAVLIMLKCNTSFDSEQEENLRKFIESKKEYLNALNEDYSLVYGDLEDTESWGVDQKGNYRLLDYGGTKKIAINQGTDDDTYQEQLSNDMGTQEKTLKDFEDYASLRDEIDDDGDY